MSVCHCVLMRLRSLPTARVVEGLHQVLVGGDGNAKIEKHCWHLALFVIFVLVAKAVHAGRKLIGDLRFLVSKADRGILSVLLLVSPAVANRKSSRVP